MEEKRIISLVKKEQVENVILKIVLIIICLMTLLLNIDEYREIFLENTSVSDNKSMEKALIKDSKYITIDVSKVNATRFSLENKGSEKAKVYELDYGEKKLLLVLHKNTAITGKIKGELLGYDSNIKTIKDKLITENNSNYYDRYFSNMDYKVENNLIKKKFYTTTIIITFLIITMIMNIIKFINPKKTRLYKKIYKKMYKIKK